MKKNLFLFVAAVVTLLSSCSKDISIVKRRYNNGYYVSTRGGVPNNHTSLKENVTQTLCDIEKKDEQGIEKSVNFSLDKNELNSEQKNTVNTLTETKFAASQNVNYNIKRNTTNFKAAKKIKKELMKPTLGENKKPSNDSELILLVILSLFPILALVAIYIKDGKKITSNFWIDLLLHFTVVGYIIYALLVVLDIVNLA